MKKIILMLLLLSFFTNSNAQPELLNYLPDADDDCVLGDNVEFRFYVNESVTSCDLYTNKTGSWTLLDSAGDFSTGFNSFYQNFSEPNILSWGMICDNTLYSNSSFTITDKPYCAVLSETVCPSETPIGSERFFQTRLGNTKGIWLENQDCMVWITDNDSVVVESYDSMMYNAEVSQALDEQGNVINLLHHDFPVTDSNGYYIFPVDINDKWAEYGREYTWHVSCNGQKTTCNFNVTRSLNPIDTAHLKAKGKELGGSLIIFLAVITLLYITYKKVRRK